MDHPGAQDLEPAGRLADPARCVTDPPGSAADDAADVDLGARLGEREEARPEPHPDVVAEEALREELEHALPVAERDVAIDEEALDLVEHRRVRDVVVAAV